MPTQKICSSLTKLIKIDSMIHSQYMINITTNPSIGNKECEKQY